LGRGGGKWGALPIAPLGERTHIGQVFHPRFSPNTAIALNYRPNPKA